MMFSSCVHYFVQKVNNQPGKHELFQFLEACLRNCFTNGVAMAKRVRIAL